MTPESPIQLAARLREALLGLRRNDEASLSRLCALYHHDVLFSDPLQTLRGRAAFIGMNRRILSRAKRLAFEIHDTGGGADSLFIAWTMTYEPHLLPTVAFEGATHCWVREGLITEQRDYWDLLSSVSRSLPIIRSLYGAIAPRLG